MISIFHFSYFYLGSTKYSFLLSPSLPRGRGCLAMTARFKIAITLIDKDVKFMYIMYSSRVRPNSPSISHPLSHNGSPLRMEEGGIWSWSTTLPTFQLTSLCSQHSLFSKNRAFPLLYSYSCTLMNVGFIILVCYAQNRYNFKIKTAHY